MVLPTPPLTPRPAPVSPPAHRPSVAGVKPVGDRQPDESGQRRPLRRRLLDLLMEEVETLPDLGDDSRSRIRRNLESFARHHPGPDQDNPPPLDPVAVAAPEHPSLTEEERTHNRALAEQLRRVLALRTITAQKIAAYIHAMQAMAPDPHELEIEA